MSDFKPGQPLPREEDPLLLRGGAQYLDDVAMDGAAYMSVVRSPHPAAKVLNVDTSAAASLPGVVCILSGRDAIADGLGEFQVSSELRRPDGEVFVPPAYPIVANDTVRYVGDPVAIVVAETRAQAEDAAEQVVVDYEPLPAVTDVAAAAAPDAPLVWPQLPGNVAFSFELGNRQAVDDRFATADHVTRLELDISRVSANPLEPRGAIARYDAETGQSVLWVGTQIPHQLRDVIARQVFKIEPERLRLIVPSVGGSFGMKNAAFSEFALVLWAARRLRRPVRWLATRSESFLSDTHGRDNRATIELALDKDGRFAALRVRNLCNLGAYIGMYSLFPPISNIRGIAGVYRTPDIHVEIRALFSHTQSVSPYRGAGRPEATYLIERVIDAAARELNLDPAELRRRNMLGPEELPYKTPLGWTYRSGNFPQVLAETLAAAAYSGFPARAADTKKRGRLRGIGVVYGIEIAGGPFGNPFPEFGGFRFDKSGDAALVMGTQDTGQGHRTTFRQIATHVLGLQPDRVRLVTGDTTEVAQGTGSFGSRSSMMAVAILRQAAEQIIERGKTLAADALEVGAGDIDFEQGVFRVAGTDRGISIHDLAADHAEALSFSLRTAPSEATFPNGCHVCEVEVDPETGGVSVERYTVGEDVGFVLNPMLAKGQVHGGVAQGLGQALMERVCFDPSSGQITTASFQDYAMPRAHHFSTITVADTSVSTGAAMLEVKGIGEAGTVGALPAAVNAVLNALAPLGVTHIDMPTSPERVWNAIAVADRRVAKP